MQKPPSQLALRLTLVYAAIATAAIVIHPAPVPGIFAVGLFITATLPSLVLLLQLRRRDTANAHAPPEIISSRLAAIVESTHEAIISKDMEGLVTSWNKGAEKIFGFTSGEMVGSSIQRLIPASKNLEENENLEKIKRGENVEHFETLRHTRGGRLIDVSITESPITDPSGKIVGTSKIARDITARKQRERGIVRLSRLYAALSQVNEAIIRLPARDEMFQKVCTVLVEYGEFSMAWIGWRDPITRELIPVAQCGDLTGYLQTIHLFTDERLDSQDPSGPRDPWGNAFREDRPAICNDMVNDPATLILREEVEGRPFRALAVLPIRMGGNACGTLAVYADEPGFFQEQEVALLTKAAADVSFALDSLAREADRQQAEYTLRHERDFSDAMLSSLPGIFYLYDQSGKFLRWNRNFEKVTGYSALEIATMSPLDFFGPRERDLVARRIEEVFQKGASNVDADLVTKDGRPIPYHFTGIMGELDGRACLVGVGIDLTERKQEEETVRASEARYRDLFEHAPSGIVIANPQSYYIDANPGMCGMFGYTREELIGMHATEIMVASHIPGITPGSLGAKSMLDYPGEWQFRRKDGTIFPVEVIATTMPDGNLMGLIRDITERKEAEMALRQSYESLEHKVTERTEELQKALVRAEAADELKSAFLATMSHELRTPLNSIIGFTGIILQGMAGPLTAEQSKQLGMVQTSGRHLLELINDVLDLSKIEAGQLEIGFAPFNLQASLERVTALVKPLADKKGLTLALVTPPEPCDMINDRRRVEQLLLNLLNNAIKFTERGGITLTAELAPGAGTPPAAKVRLCVADTGIGIKTEDMDTLFQPFRQVDTGLDRQHEGTGLGLAICRRLAMLLGGEIVVSSKWQTGSEFCVTLPQERLDHQ